MYNMIVGCSLRDDVSFDFVGVFKKLVLCLKHCGCQVRQSVGNGIH